MSPVSQKNCLNIPWWWVVRQSFLNTILVEKIRLWPRLGLPRQRKKSYFAEADGTRSVQHWQVVLSTKTQADSSMKKSGFVLSPYSYWADIRSEYLFIKLTKTICIARYILSKCINYRDLFNWKKWIVNYWLVEEWNHEKHFVHVIRYFIQKKGRRMPTLKKNFVLL